MSLELRRGLIGSNVIKPLPCVPLVAPLDFFENLESYSDVNIVEIFNREKDKNKKYALKILNSEEELTISLPNASYYLIYETINGVKNKTKINVQTYTFTAKSTQRCVIVCTPKITSADGMTTKQAEWMYCGFCSSCYVSNTSMKINSNMKYIHYNGMSNFDGLGYCSFYGPSKATGDVFVPKDKLSFSAITFSSAPNLTGVRFTGLTRKEYLEKVSFADNINSNPLVHAHKLYLDEVEFTEFPNIEGLSKIGDSILAGCYSLKGDVNIPNGVVSIGSFAFAECKNITSITIPNSVVSIGNSALKGLSACRYIKIPTSVTKIGTDCLTSSRFANTRVIINAPISTLVRQWSLGPFYWDFPSTLSSLSLFCGGKYLIFKSIDEVPTGVKPYLTPTIVFVPKNMTQVYKDKGWNFTIKEFDIVNSINDLPQTPQDDTWFYQEDENILWHYMNEYINFTDTCTP